MDTRDILQKVKVGSLSIEEAEGFLRRQPYEEMEFAKVDTHRKLRLGFAEVIYCSGKTTQQLVDIFGRILQEEGEVLGTRASEEQYQALKTEFPGTEADEDLQLPHHKFAPHGCQKIPRSGLPLLQG